MNLFTVGTRRDTQKWPGRDKRKDPQKSDLINFDFLSPYIIQKVIRSLDILKELYEKASRKQETVFYKGIRIKRLMLKSTGKYYQMALSIFLGDQVLKRVGTLDGIDSMEAVRERLSSGEKIVPDKWIDMAGMVAPDLVIRNLLEEIRTGRTKTLNEITEGLEVIHHSYDTYTWEWTTSSKIGFGIDGDKAVVDLDFIAVRGTPEQNKFIRGITHEIKLIETKATEVRTKLETVFLR